MSAPPEPIRFLIPGIHDWQDTLAPRGGGESVRGRSEALSSHLLASLQMQNLLVLTGLGTSTEVGGPTMDELWGLCVGEQPAGSTQQVLKRLHYDNGEKNIEELLSRCDAHLQVVIGDSDIAAFREDAIGKILLRCRAVTSQANHDLQPHREFIRRLARRRVRDPRLRLFTTNYDMCFERAAGELGLTTIDGFSFASPRRFDPRYFDYDVVRRGALTGDGQTYVPGVFQYFKLHGSVDWASDDEGRVTIDGNVDGTRACLIYPTQRKFQISFQQPHLELMAQFLSSLRQPNTCLVIVGFGFNDTHLSEPILSALETNPHLRVLVVSRQVDRKFSGEDVVSKQSETEKVVWKRLKKAFERGHDVGFVKASFSRFVPLIPDLRVLTAGERLVKDIQQAVDSE